MGAGVASLTLAHDLLRLGYAVDVFEWMAEPGGMLYYGVPKYRLKNEVVVNECYAIEALGAKMYYNHKIGRDKTMGDLLSQYDAVFLGVGLWKSRDLPIPGADQPDIIKGIDYLRVLCAGGTWPIKKHTVVVGGGNVAFDVARSSVRNGAETVTMVCLESRDEQTADEFEIEDGMEEGIKILNRLGPKEVVRDAEGNVTGLKVQQILSLFDAEGRFAPRWIEGTELIIPCDCIALAIGQALDTSFMEGWEEKGQLALDRGLIKIERGTGRTSIPKLYVGGDAGYGPALFITAIKHGQESARAIDHDLLGTNPYQEFSAEFHEIQPMRDKTYLKTKYALPTAQPVKGRVHNLNMVENNYTLKEAIEQSNRCLQCHVSPVFDGSLCIKCNGCVDVCPTNCLSQVPISKLNLDLADGSLRQAVDNYYGVESCQMESGSLDQMGTAMLKDEDLCIRCGLCAEKCPTQAVTMDLMQYTYRWIG